MTNILYPIIIPLIAGCVTFAIGKRFRGVKETLTLIVTAVNLVIAVLLYKGDINVVLPWAGFGMEFSLRLYHFSSFILLGAAFFGFVVSLYSIVFMSGKNFLNQYYAYLLITIGLVNGAALANNLVLLLFFWEGLLITMFGMIAIGGKQAFKTATKTIIIVGVSDLCMMIGIAITAHLAGTLTISEINLALTPLGVVAFILLMIGAIAKAGSMPFHSWIPDAAQDAPLPFMAILPASLEKLLGIYFLARISLDMFKLDPSSWVSTMLMIIGAFTIIMAVLAALIQKEYKKLLSFHAISQVGYMILGIGTCLPIGIVGGLFHMINHAMYKSCLFLTGGAVEKQTGTTDLAKLGGLVSKMPITFICFFIAAASISGVPPFNGFFSKELVYDAAMERGMIFYIAAILGSFLTAASFLKLGHAAYFGRANESLKNVKEAHWSMLVPMILIAAVCVLFGVYNQFPIRELIQPILPAQLLAGHDFAGIPPKMILIVVTVIVLVGAVINHMYGAKMSGSGLKASDHIRYTKGLSPLFDRAERRFFDPYELGLKFVRIFSKVTWFIDRKIDWIYDGFSVNVATAFSNGIKWAHTGNYALYIIWSLVGAVLVMIYMIK